jgi:hypothetical protein|tara:strand:- start:3846 stop:4433 length:588 start_codon:yes stop_codon:yes gene_type:complete
MKVNSNKVILVDADGVLLDWVHSFEGWMDRYGYEVVEPGEYRMDVRYGLTKEEGNKLCCMFNESATIRKIPPLRDAIKYVRKLHEEHGYIFRVISSLSLDTYAGRLRTKNLIELFGPSVFDTYTYLDTGADKDDALEPYRNSGCYWVEDKVQNADLGYDLGLDAILMKSDSNTDYSGPATFVNNWKEIYNHIVGE